ncbi:MAG: hypothetical protein JXQ27_07760 [Acidobacteria bacterium]|nr:hypothetical protein [Acidobacteriota bacterium]
MKKQYHLLCIGSICLILMTTQGVIRTRADGVMPSESDPTALLPADTLFYLEIRDAATALDRLSERAVWPELTALADGLAGRTAGFTWLREICRQWPVDEALRRQFRDVAGERIVVAVIPAADTPAGLVALRGAAGGPSPRQVADLLHQLGATASVDEKAGAQRLTDDTDELGWSGWPAGEWFVLAPERDAPRLAALEAALAGRRSEAEPLAGLASFADTMPELPGPSVARGFVNTRGLALELARHNLTDRPAARLLMSLLCRIDGIAFARQITPEGIVTRAAGRLQPARDEDPVWSLVHETVPLTDHGRCAVPADALGVYETSLSATELMSALTTLLEEAGFPPVETWTDRFPDLDAAFGLELVAELLPSLGDGLTLALLRGGLADSALTLPQPLMVIPVKDESAVRATMDDLLAWKAGSVAASTGGLLGATVVTEMHEGVELRGLQLEGLLPVPFISPTTAVTDGRLIISPFREAVRTAVTTLHQGRPAWVSADIRLGGGIPATGLLVGTGMLDMAGLGAVMLDLARRCPQPEKSAGSFWSLTGRLLQTFGPASGTTVLTPDGRFTCEFNVSFGADRTDDPSPLQHAP